MDFYPFPQTQYKIISALNEDMVLDCSEEQGNPLILWRWHQGFNQRWHIQKIQKHKFVFTNAFFSKVISAPSRQKNQGCDIKCKDPSKMQLQNWQIIPFSDQYFKDKFVFSLRSFSGKAMDVCEGKAKNGQKIIEWDERKTGKIKQRLNQLWILEPVSFITDLKANYKIFTALDQDLVFDISKQKIDLNEISLCHFHKKDNQYFNIQFYMGKYLIINKQNNYSLQIKEESSQNQAHLVAGPIRRDRFELWDIIPCKDNRLNLKGAFYLRSHCEKFLDLSNGQATDRAKVFQWDYHGNKNQLWYIHKL